MFSADTLQQALVQDYGRLCTLANKILQDSHLAQDAVQESWLRLNRARPDTTDAEKLRHLLLVTVRHTALNMRRSRRAEPAEDAVFAALPDAGPLPQEKLERSEAVRCLLAAMQALEDVYKRQVSFRLRRNTAAPYARNTNSPIMARWSRKNSAAGLSGSNRTNSACRNKYSQSRSRQRA